MLVKISLSPQQVTVERNGETHVGRWSQRGGNDAQFTQVEGSQSLLRAVMTAWTGQREFEISDDELVEQGGGWWTPE